jgi:UDP-glucose 4-epimerase
MSQTILVTGGAGYIGTIATEILLLKGFNVIVLDDLSTGYTNPILSELKFYNCNYGDKEALSKIFSENNIDTVMHFAGAALVEESVRNPAKYYDINFSQSVNMLDVMINHNIKKIIFSSTCAVYGIPVNGNNISETTDTKPINPYGESKLLFENALKWYKEKYGLEYIALRFFNVAGATEKSGEKHNPETHLIPLVLKSINDRDFKLKVYGNDYPTNDGTAIRDYIHVVDLIEGHINALEAITKGKNYSNVYNLGYGHGYSVLEIIKAVEKVLNTKVNYEITDRREGDPPILVADTTNIKKDLNWIPKHDDIHEIIRTASFHQH